MLPRRPLQALGTPDRSPGPPPPVIRGRERLLRYRARRGLEPQRSTSSFRIWNPGKGKGGENPPPGGKGRGNHRPKALYRGSPGLSLSPPPSWGPKFSFPKRKEDRASGGKVGDRLVSRSGRPLLSALPSAPPGFLVFGLEMKRTEAWAPAKATLRKSSLIIPNIPSFYVCVCPCLPHSLFLP